MTSRASMLAALGLLAAGCGDSASSSGTMAGAGGTAGAAGAGTCEVRVQEQPIEGNNHVEVCSTVGYSTSPPSSGDHYGYWAAFGEYESPLPHGFLVHGLEHGAVAFTYNCPDGCADEVAVVRDLLDRRVPADAFCLTQGSQVRRYYLTPDPSLSSRWGLSSWGYTLNAECVDADRFLDFYVEHFDKGPEHLCNEGYDVAELSGGAPCGPPEAD